MSYRVQKVLAMFKNTAIVIKVKVKVGYLL